MQYWVSVFPGDHHTFSEEQEEMYVHTSSAVLRCSFARRVLRWEVVVWR